MLSTRRLLDELTRHTDAFADAVTATDPAAAVGPCPEWTVRDLAAHLGGVHRWAAAHVAERRAKLERRDGDAPPPPEGPAALAAWLREGAELVVAAVDGADDDTPVGGFGAPVTVGWWARRQCHETLVHRGDAEIAAGIEPWVGLAADVAADGIDEHLALVLLGSRRRTALHGGGETLHLHATDEGLGDAGEWVITRGDGDLHVEHGHRRADVAVRGPAVTLLGVVTSRLDPRGAESPGAEILGDAALLDHWLAHATI